MLSTCEGCVIAILLCRVLLHRIAATNSGKTHMWKAQKAITNQDGMLV